MKFPLAWHREGLTNSKLHLTREEHRLASMVQSVDDLRGRVAFAQEQLDEAQRRGLEEFDPERFLRRRATRLCRP